MNQVPQSAEFRISWAPQPGPQHDLVTCPLPEVFFGGARGGGKTDGVLGKWALKERRYGAAFNALLLRPSTISAEDAVERSREIYGPLGGKFRDMPPRWRMPNGGRVRFGYLESVKDADEWQGRNVTDLGIEEAGLYPDPAPIDRMFGVLRSSAGVPVQMILTANPGGAGQHWIRKRYGLSPFPLKPKVLRRKLPDGTEHKVAVIPSRITDNKILLDHDPGYVSRLYLVGSAQLVKAWLEGDWTAIEGAFFSEWEATKHVIQPFAVPDHWLRFRSGDWGSYAPFSFGWWAVASDDYNLGVLDEASVHEVSGHGNGSVLSARSNRVVPRGALVRYREWYGQQGGKLTADQVGRGLVQRERSDPKLAYGVLDPSTFNADGGPSIAERINAVLIAEKIAAFREADNKRISRVVGDPAKGGPMGGWDMMRQRLIGTAKRRDDGAIDWSTGSPMMFFFSTCADAIRTIPLLQHDPVRAEDLDTKSEDHCFVADTLVATPHGPRLIAEMPKDGLIWDGRGKLAPYRNCRLTRRDAPVIRLTFDDGSLVTCTADHRLKTIDGRWVEARKMLNERSYASILPAWMGRAYSAIPCKNSRVATIIDVAAIFSAKARDYIARYGAYSTAPFRGSHTSITRMGMLRTINRIISNVSRRLLISPTMGGYALATPQPVLQNMLDLRRRSGTLPRLVGHGIRVIGMRMLSRRWNEKFRESARIADAILKEASNLTNSVPMRANPRGDVLQKSIMSSGLASNAEKLFELTSIQKRRAVLESAAGLRRDEKGRVCLAIEDAGRADVYCLTVPTTASFHLANGIVVANCADEVRYACLSRPWVRPTPAVDGPKTTGYGSVYRSGQLQDNYSSVVTL